MRRAKQFTRQDAAVLLISVALVLNLAVVGESGRERAKRAVCLANLKQLTLAWNLYAEDNDGKIVNGDTQEYTSMYRPEMPPQASHYEELPWVLRDWMTTATVEQKEQAIRGGALYPYSALSLPRRRSRSDARLCGRGFDELQGLELRRDGQEHQPDRAAERTIRLHRSGRRRVQHDGRMDLLCEQGQMVGPAAGAP